MQGSQHPSVLETLRSLFPDKGDLLEERLFSKLHKIVLRILPCNIEEALRTCEPVIDDVDANGNMALMWAAQRGDSKTIDLLIKAGANIDYQTHIKNSALLYAAKQKNLTCVKLLLEAGANCLQVDFQGFNALHYAAAFSDNRDIIRCLFERGVNLEGRTVWGTTPLILSAVENETNSVATLLDYRANINAIDNDGDTALYNAIHFASDDATQLLLQRGAAYTQINKIRNSILHPLAASGGLRSLDIMLAAQLRDINTKAINKDGKTALQIARERVDKPDGFVGKFQELLAGIRVRNAELERTGGGNSSVVETNQRLRLSKMVRLAWGRLFWIRFISGKTQFHNRLTNLLRTIRPPCWKAIWQVIWNSLSIHWIMGLFLAAVLYPWLGTSVDIAKQVLVLVWDLAGPREMEDL